MLTALTVAAVVCIASSNGGTTSQDLKTGFLVGATPRWQQLAITVGAVTSALVIGGTMLALNAAGTHYIAKGLPKRQIAEADLVGAPTQQVGRPYDDKDSNVYRVVHITRDEDHRKKYPDVKPGRYLVDDQGWIKYKTDIPIAQEANKTDYDTDAPRAFAAPQPELFRSIIEGILGGTLEWAVFMVGVLIAISLELAGVRALPFAVGMYIPLSSTTPIFIGGLLRWVTDRWRGVSASEAETETSPGVLLSSGYIAGGTLVGLLLAFFAFLPDSFNRAINISIPLGANYADVQEVDRAVKKATNEEQAAAVRGSRYSAAWLESNEAKILSLLTFLALMVILVRIGTRKNPEPEPLTTPSGNTSSPGDGSQPGG
jgi:hypothetical protein